MDGKKFEAEWSEKELKWKRMIYARTHTYTEENKEYLKYACRCVTFLKEEKSGNKKKIGINS